MFVVDAAELSAPCGIATTPGEAPQSASLVAQASATVLKDSGSVLGCVSGEDSADLVLAAVEQ
jgi:arginine repressor